MSWSNRPSAAAGAYPRADEVEAILDQIDQLTDPGSGTWTDFSSTLAWTSSGAAPAFGNATKLAEYRRPSGSDMVDVRIKITFGNTTTFGTGVYFLSLPANAATNQIAFGAGWAYALDAGIQEYGGICKIENATTFRMIPASNNTDSVTNWGQTAPFTFGNTDVLAAQLRYQAT